MFWDKARVINIIGAKAFGCYCTNSPRKVIFRFFLVGVLQFPIFLKGGNPLPITKGTVSLKEDLFEDLRGRFPEKAEFHKAK